MNKLFRNKEATEEDAAPPPSAATGAKGGSTPTKSVRRTVVVQRTRGDRQQDSKFLRELAVDKTFVQVRLQI
jgi:hypothetical protein